MGKTAECTHPSKPCVEESAVVVVVMPHLTTGRHKEALEMERPTLQKGLYCPFPDANDSLLTLNETLPGNGLTALQRLSSLSYPASWSSATCFLLVKKHARCVHRSTEVMGHVRSFLAHSANPESTEASPPVQLS